MTKKYRVVYAMSYDIDAEDEQGAEEIAFDLFKEDVGGSSRLDMFGTNVEVLEDENKRV